MNTTNKKDALGKGIRSLLQNIDSDLKITAGTLKEPVAERITGINRIPLSYIVITLTTLNVLIISFKTFCPILLREGNFFLQDVLQQALNLSPIFNLL